jgi:hypothetical protein
MYLNTKWQIRIQIHLQASSQLQKRKIAANLPSQPPSPCPATPEWDKGLLSQAQREKRRFKMSMSTMHQSISVADINTLASTLSGKGTSQQTWGVPRVNPIEGARRSRNRRRIDPRNLRDFESANQAYAAMMEKVSALNEQKREAMEVKVNSPENSPVLKVSLEVRERIYGFLLRYPKPIMVKHDWTTVERNPFVSHSIFFVCKQFAQECTNFLFRSNVIVSLLRAPTHQVRRYDEPAPIPKYSLSLYRNIKLDCAVECWNVDWLEKATLGLKRFVDAKACIENLTLKFVPQRVGMSSISPETESNPVTFADFLWFDGDLMRTIIKIAPKMLTVVIKKGGRQRFVVQVDMRYLRHIEMEEGPLVNPETLRVAREKASNVEAKRKGLKDLYEEIFKNHPKVVFEGRCTMFLNNKTMIRQITGWKNS